MLSWTIFPADVFAIMTLKMIVNDQCTFTAKWNAAFRQQLFCFGVSAFQFSLLALGIAKLTFGISDLAFSSWHFHAFQAFSISVFAFSIYLYRSFQHSAFRI